jgi:uncharacterized alpha-E superfamily protein
LFLQQPDAPRSIFHNLHQIKTSLRSIRQDLGEPNEGPMVATVADLLQFIAKVRLSGHFNDEATIGVAATGKLSDILATLLDRLYQLHPDLSDHYFSHQALIAPTVAPQAEFKL